MVKFNLYSDQKDLPFSSQRRESKFIYEWVHDRTLMQSHDSRTPTFIFDKGKGLDVQKTYVDDDSVIGAESSSLIRKKSLLCLYIV